jgi:hypothetical protein
VANPSLHIGVQLSHGLNLRVPHSSVFEGCGF